MTDSNLPPSSSTATTAETSADLLRHPRVVVGEWAERERKISVETLGKLHVASGTEYFGELQRKADCMKFIYPDGKWKARAVPEKAFTSQKGLTPSFWNLDAVLAGNAKRVYITEGELDACALVEVGIPADAVLACPSANIAEAAVLDALKAGLSRVKRFVWCGDADEKGFALRSQMARTLGIGKVDLVNWPEGIKDANDFLRKDGAVALRDLVVDGAIAWPVIGLYSMDEIPDNPLGAVWSTGFAGWEGKIALAPGTLSVVTGHPGHGKTKLMGQIWQQIVMRYNLVAAIASFETRPRPYLRRQLRELYLQRLELTATDEPYLIREADDWIRDHYRFMQHPDRRPDLPWFLEMAESAVVRHGAKVIQLDPWNRLEASREPRESETDYIGRCLRELYNFAVDMNCHVQIIAHPAKTGEYARRDSAPELEHIAGSKHWDNMVDQGFVVHRPQMFNDSGVRQTYAELHHKKARFEELGYPTKLGVEFDYNMGRFGVCDLRTRKPKTETKPEPEKEQP